MEELRSLSEVSDYKYELLEAYSRILKLPKKELKKELNAILLLKVDFYPYWMIRELTSLGFDFEEQFELF